MPTILLAINKALDSKLIQDVLLALCTVLLLFSVYSGVRQWWLRGQLDLTKSRLDAATVTLAQIQVNSAKQMDDLTVAKNQAEAGYRKAMANIKRLESRPIPVDCDGAMAHALNFAIGLQEESR